jgi:hypothetical protein
MTTLEQASEDATVQHELTPEESAADILKRELPRLMNDVSMLVARPFRFVWDPASETASTDCIAEIRVAPRPFIEGEREVGYGTVYHETGHIRFSPYGTKLLARANDEGGPVLQSLINIILDRKDDSFTAEHAPGFADTLRRRLLVIRTLVHRMQYKSSLSRMSLAEQSRFLRNAKPKNAYEDFFLSAKCGKAPRLPATKRAMKHVRMDNIRGASLEKLLWIAKRVREILGDDAYDNQSQARAESGFVSLWTEADKAERGDKVKPELLQAINAAVKVYISALRARNVDSLIRQIAALGMQYPGPLSVGVTQKVKVEKVPPQQRHLPQYEAIKSRVKGLIDPLVKALRNISTPSEFELYGRDEGDLDLSETARIATRLSGFYQETVVERDIDAEIHLAIDSSGSMAGDKIERAKEIAVVFTEAILAINQVCLGRIWSFNSESIDDYGPASRTSGFVLAEGSAGNSDTFMLPVVGKELLKSPKRRKILIVLCDDGPDSIELVKKFSQQLMARGVILIHLLVGVHGTPDIYPVELVYSSIEECLDEFGDLLKTIVSHLK